MESEQEEAMLQFFMVKHFFSIHLKWLGISVCPISLEGFGQTSQETLVDPL